MFNLNGIILPCEDEVKLLGTTIDFKLNQQRWPEIFQG
jgi:hypothetical protein